METNTTDTAAEIVNGHSLEGEKIGRVVCQECGRAIKACLCHVLPEKGSLHTTETSVLVIQSAAEAERKVATAWLLPRILSKAQVLPARNVEIPLDAVLLFPGNAARPLVEFQNVSALVLIDGTWKSARRILNSSEYLQKLPRAFLPDQGDHRETLFKVRRPPAKITGARSTAEAAADAIEILEGDESMEAVKAIRAAVHEASEVQLRFIRQNGVENVPHRKERPGYVAGLYENESR